MIASASDFLWITRRPRSGPSPETGSRPAPGSCGAGEGLLRADACYQNSILLFFSATSDAEFDAFFECIENTALGDCFHILQINKNNRSYTMRMKINSSMYYY